jgi:catechol 2,3-dioxygenase
MDFSIDSKTVPGLVSLTVQNLERSLEFYCQILGMKTFTETAPRALLGAGDDPFLELVENRAAQVPSRPTTGLYHFAVLFPSRAALADTLRQLASSRWPLQGFADHSVSEAVYLADPEGNGIELYRDRPRAEWQIQGSQVTMTTEPLDVDGLLGESQPGEYQGLPPGTILGHMHLRVNDLAAAVEFYTRSLGFDLTARYGPSAAFVSAGGYHHHMGFNTWNSAGAPPPPQGAAGLRYFSLRLPSSSALQALVEHLRQEEPALTPENGGYQVSDPAGNSIRLEVAPPSAG